MRIRSQHHSRHCSRLAPHVWQQRASTHPTKASCCSQSLKHMPSCAAACSINTPHASTRGGLHAHTGTSGAPFWSSAGEVGIQQQQLMHTTPTMLLESVEHGLSRLPTSINNQPTHQQSYAMTSTYNPSKQLEHAVFAVFVDAKLAYNRMCCTKQVPN